MHRPASLLLCTSLVALAAAQQPQQQQQQQQPQPQSPPKAGSKPAAFSPEQLEQLVAPIALYPDALLTQTMMASTYPLEVVQAARWVQKNPKVQGEALEKALKEQTWDPSVKSLCGLPSVLQRMNDNLDWTQDLGDAFLADQAALMDAVQRMRRKALEAGNLKTTKEQKVTEREDKIIVVEAADPQIVYVPTYYPTVVYGGWYYPHWYYPPLYVPPPPLHPAFTFAVGVAWGAAMWGGCSWGWGHSEVDIDIDRTNNFIGRTEVDHRRAERQRKDGKWQHQPEHRQGVRYRDNATSQRYSRPSASNRIASDQARGYGSGSRPSAGAAARPAAGGGAATRPTSTTTQRSGSFTGSQTANLDRAASQRGSAS
ncbi:MAG: DUF3300 domain-containing protein, partial [Planctomycetes bacterium]|nr:DUF3300 domain-containing protein [Planctomycetota bacterium]